MHARDWLRYDGKHVPEPMSGCEIWLGTLDVDGYGVFHVGSWARGTKRLVKAHRLAYERARGPIPEGLTIDHLCGCTWCVNPWHMEPVTLAENARRAQLRRPTKLTCRRGHPFEGANLYRGKKGDCLECRRVRRAEWNAKLSRERATRRESRGWKPYRSKG